MAAVRGRDNAAETALRKHLWRLGLRYRLYASYLPGKPDLVFACAKTVVFVDGDFWHGRILLEQGESALRAQFRGKAADWWVAKIKRTAARDQAITAELRARRWYVIRVWEKDVLKKLDVIAARLARRLNRRRLSASQATR